MHNAILFAFFSGTQLTTRTPIACKKRRQDETQIQCRPAAERQRRPSKWFENGQKCLKFIERFAFIHSSRAQVCALFGCMNRTNVMSTRDMFLNLSEMCAQCPATAPGNTTTQFFSVRVLAATVWLRLAHFSRTFHSLHPSKPVQRPTHLI